MLGTREYTLCSPFRANAHNSSFHIEAAFDVFYYGFKAYSFDWFHLSTTCFLPVNKLSLLRYNYDVSQETVKQVKVMQKR